MPRHESGVTTRSTRSDQIVERSTKSQRHKACRRRAQLSRVVEVLANHPERSTTDRKRGRDTAGPVPDRRGHATNAFRALLVIRRVSLGAHFGKMCLELIARRDRMTGHAPKRVRVHALFTLVWSQPCEEHLAECRTVSWLADPDARLDADFSLTVDDFDVDHLG